MFIKQLPLTVRASHKTDVRSQFAALCYRIVQNKPQVLLITARKSGRWIIPKGWPMDGMTPARSAAQEAWEEAGVIGKAVDRCLGLYSYNKNHCTVGGMPCVAMVFPVRVKSLAQNFPERKQRRRRWFSPKKAASRVLEPELARILRDFDPRILH
ncbi:NUDIX hydrolase [Rhodobacteraceae bacterium F11138]|nr:NUDIX hydrolase [Rhodobacteraceae bacterium F11138]